MYCGRAKNQADDEVNFTCKTFHVCRQMEREEDTPLKCMIRKHWMRS